MSFDRRPAKESPFEAANFVDSVTATIGAEVANVINVALVAKDPNNRAIPGSSSRTGPSRLACYLSDDAAGQVQATVTPTTVAIGTNGLLLSVTTGLVFDLITTAAGLVDINITKNSAHTYYLQIVLPSGNIQTVGPIALT